MRGLLHDALAKQLVPFPVGHEGVVELPGAAQLLVEDHVLDGHETVDSGADAHAREPGTVVFGATVHNVLATLHAAVHGGGDDRKGHVVARDVFADARERDVPIDEVLYLALGGVEHLVEARHLVQVACGKARPVLRLTVRSRHRVLAVVDGEEDRTGDPPESLLTGASVRGPVVPTSSRLHAADEAVVARRFDRHAPIQQRGDDHLVALEGRHPAAGLRSLHGYVPQQVGRALVDAERHGRIVQQQTARALEEHVGDLVGGVDAVLRDAPQGDELPGGVASRGRGGERGPDLVHLGDLEAEEIEDLLSPFARDPPGGQIVLVEAVQVLIDAAEGEAVQVAVER